MLRGVALSYQESGLSLSFALLFQPSDYDCFQLNIIKFMRCFCFSFSLCKIVSHFNMGRKALSSSSAKTDGHCSREYTRASTTLASSCGQRELAALCCYLLPQLLPSFLLHQPAVASLHQFAELVLSGPQLLQTLLVAEFC